MTASIRIHDGDFDGMYYIRLTVSYFKSSGDEPDGIWMGGAARRLGLPAIVEPAAFKALLAGKTPNGQQWLSPTFRQTVGRRQGAKSRHQRTRASSFDICYSVPKSVSALWAIADEATQAIIERDVIRAARTVNSWLEKKVALGRRG